MLGACCGSGSDCGCRVGTDRFGLRRDTFRDDDVMSAGDREWESRSRRARWDAPGSACWQVTV
jgi:hypothetical protein